MNGPRLELELQGDRIRDWVGDHGANAGLAPAILGGQGAGDLGHGITVIAADLPGGSVTLAVWKVMSAQDGDPVDRWAHAALNRVRAFADDLLDLADNIDIRVIGRRG